MKTLICLMTIAVAVNGLDQAFVDQMKERVRMQVEACAKEVSASPNDLAEVLARKIPTSHEGKCIFFCMHKIYNAQNDDGSLNIAGAFSNLDLLKDLDADLYNKMFTAFKTCQTTPPDSDPCVFASNLAECVVREGKAAGLSEVLIH